MQQWLIFASKISLATFLFKARWKPVKNIEKKPFSKQEQYHTSSRSITWLPLARQKESHESRNYSFLRRRFCEPLYFRWTGVRLLPKKILPIPPQKILVHPYSSATFWNVAWQLESKQTNRCCFATMPLYYELINTKHPVNSSMLLMLPWLSLEACSDQWFL